MIRINETKLSYKIKGDCRYKYVSHTKFGCKQAICETTGSERQKTFIRMKREAEFHAYFLHATSKS